MSTYLDNAGLTNVLVKIKSLLATKASITAIPTKVSSLENDSGYQTSSDVTAAIPKNVSAFTNDSGYQTASDVTSKIPTKVSELTNDSGYLTNASLSVPTKVSELENDSSYQTDTEVSTLVKTEINDRTSFVYQANKSLNSDWYVHYISRTINSDGSLAHFNVYHSKLEPKIKSIVSDLQTAGTVPTTDSVASQIATALDGVTGIEFVVVDSLPATPAKGTIYLVPKGTYDSNSVTVSQTDSSGNTVTDVMQDSYDEYIWVSESTTDGVTTYNYEKIGSTDVDLSQYAKTADVPTKTSELTNDSGYITSDSIPTVPTKVSELENDSGYQTASDVESFVFNSAHKQNYSATDRTSFVSEITLADGKMKVTYSDLPSVDYTSADGKYIASVTQTGGKLSATYGDLPSFTDSAVDGKYVSSVSQSNGKITVTRADLPSGGSTDTPIPNETIDSIFTEVFG